MAVEDLGRFLRVPGKLVANPTNFAGAFPYGGTQLGAVREVAVRPRRAHEALTAEEYGAEVVEVVDLGESWVLAASLRGFDDDAVSAVFAATALGASSGHKVVDYPGSFQAGVARSASAIGLLFAPDDPLRYPAVWFPAALPVVDASAELTLQLNEEGVVGVVFYATRRAADKRAAQVGLLEDLAA